jgi:hypothetical protein
MPNSKNSLMPRRLTRRRSSAELARRRSSAQLASAAAVAGLITGLAACGSSGSPAPANAGNTAKPQAAGNAAPGGSQAPVPPETHPAGDIPDSTVYVPYQAAPGHLQLNVPEGWSRQTSTTTSMFTSNLNSVAVSWHASAAAPTVTSVRATTIPTLQAHSLAFRLQDVRAVTLPGGPAVEIIYQVNSPPNSVTGRQYRLVVEHFELYHSGRVAVLELSSAVGSDNVDPWRKVSGSFRWM